LRPVPSPFVLPGLREKPASEVTAPEGREDAADKAIDWVGLIKAAAGGRWRGRGGGERVRCS